MENTKNNNHFGLNDDDLIFLFGKNKDKAIKSLEVLYNKNPKYTDYDVIDILSHGHGREAYMKLSTHRMQSEEYMNAFNVVNNHKFLDLSTTEGKERHINRNKNQYGKAPKDLKTMKEFVKRGYFIEEGYNPCHNIVHDTEDERKAMVSRTIYLVKHGLIHNPSEAKLGNISFRGTPSSSFEGCQFIYNDKTGKLVTDAINRGTWDYGKYGTGTHYVFDVSPWIVIGNGNNIERPEMFIMSMKDEKMYLKTSFKDFEKVKADELGTKTADIIRKGMSSSESVKVDATFIDAERTKRYNQSIEDCSIDFISRCSEMPLSFLDPDWNNYISFCTMVDDKTLISGLEAFVNSMDSEPCGLKSLITDENKAKYKFFLLKSSMKCIDKEFTSGMEIKNDLPIILTININSGFSNRLKTMISQDDAIKEYHKIRDDLLISAISEKLASIGFKCRVLDDVSGPNSYDSFKLTVSQLRVVSKEEAIMVNDARKKIEPKEEFAKEELNVYHAPEYSIEGAFGNIMLGIGISSLAFGITYLIALLFDKLVWSKNRKIIKIIQDNIDIFEKPMIEDYKKYTILYNKFIKDASFINSLYTSDKYGKYCYENNSTEYTKDSFLNVDISTFENDMVNKLYYAIKAMKNKSPKEIKKIFDNLAYTYVVAEGKPLLELITEFNGTDYTYDPISGKYKTNDEKPSDISYQAGALDSTFRFTKKSIIANCNAIERKGFAVIPVFTVNGYASEENDHLFNTSRYSSLDIDAVFYLCMETSITYDKFFQLKTIIDEEMNPQPEED